MKVLLRQKINSSSLNFCGDNQSKDYRINVKSNKNRPIPNFKKVDEVLLRGAQPNPKQFENLQKQGVGVIVNLRTLFVKGLPFDEKKVVQNLGMKYESLPVAARKGPSLDDVKKFFSLVDDAGKNGKKIFVHCMAGQDRTGSMCALYEIKKNIASPKKAFDEMISMGHNQKLYPDLVGKLKELTKKI